MASSRTTNSFYNICMAHVKILLSITLDFCTVHFKASREIKMNAKSFLFASYVQLFLRKIGGGKNYLVFLRLAKKETKQLRCELVDCSTK